MNVRALHARVQLAQQRPHEALATRLMTADDLQHQRIGPAMYGEYLATRAVALAVFWVRLGVCAAADEAASNDVAPATPTSSANQSRALVTLGESDAGNDAAESLLEHRGPKLDIWDSVVCAIRAAPSCSTPWCEYPDHKISCASPCFARTISLLRSRLGLIHDRDRMRGSLLSPREREIMEHRQARQAKR